MVTILWRSDHEKDLEILLLRQQLRILQRKQLQPPRISRWEKRTLLVLAGKLTALTTSTCSRLCQRVRRFKPDTHVTWHRELVRRKWTFKKKAPLGRPPIAPEVEAFLLRLAHKHPTWGYGKLAGELRKLGYDIARDHPGCAQAPAVLATQHIRSHIDRGPAK